MAIFKISPIITFGPGKDYYCHFPVEWKNAYLHKRATEVLAEEVEKEGHNYGGVKTFTAKIKFSGFQNPDYSFIQVAFEENRTDILLNWAIILCPLGNVKIGAEPPVCIDDDALCRSIYNDRCSVTLQSRHADLPTIVSYLISSGAKFKTIDAIIAEAKHIKKSEEASTLKLPEIMPSKTSLAMDFMEADFRISIEKLEEIFQGG